MNGWMPIETAPKDGTHILVGVFDIDKGGFGWYGGEWVYLQTVAHWFDDGDECGFYPSVSNDGDKSTAVPATHWHPLLPTPTSVRA